MAKHKEYRRKKFTVKPQRPQWFIGGKSEEHQTLSKFAEAGTDAEVAKNMDVDSPALEKMSKEIRNIISEQTDMPVMEMSEFNREGISVNYEYKKPIGFEQTILAQKNRISDTSLDLSLVELYGALGLTNEGIAAMHGVHAETVTKWVMKFPEFKTALNRGKQSADAEVVRSMFQRATGYKYTETAVEMKPVFDKSGMPAINPVTGEQHVQRTVRTTVKEVPPDTEMAKFWMVNRQKEIWKLVWKLEANFKSEIVVKELAGLTDAELQKYASGAKN